ncbi:hypothetical protein ACH4F6_38750 [Streptomyces sp. NPDC017936]|uniref:SCO2400 family protein n=1 Tax=Streptomyces sp. NPDC017936 TaxID=3365016 RepID=UPI00379266FD
MDYCSACRRHLNGALVCPGCGAYAPDIAPPVTNSRTAPVGDAIAVAGTDAPSAWPAGRSTTMECGDDSPPSGEAEIDPGTGSAAGGETVVSTGLGRAARRRQLARWNKNKRRAAVATAVAIVGGGLTIATMDRDSAGRAQAATTPDRHSMGLAEEQVPENSRPAPAAPADGRTSHSSVQPEDAGAVRQQPSAIPAPAEPLTSQPAPARPRHARPAVAVPPPQAAPSQPAARTTTPPSAASVPDSSSTTATQPSDSTASADSTQAHSSQADAPPASTSPSGLCLLVLCLG